jgi:hypothetical protein
MSIGRFRGQELAQQMASSNPELVEQLRRETERAGAGESESPNDADPHPEEKH